MANQQTAFGFRHIGFLPGFSPDYQILTRQISSANTTKIFRNDPVVKVGASGFIAQAANNTTVLEGIFDGCMFIPSTGGPPTWSPFWPGAAASNATAYIINAPGALFLAATLNTSLSSVNIGANVGFNIGTGSTVGGGFSGATLDQATITTNNAAPFQVVDLYNAASTSNFGALGNGSDQTTPFGWAVVTFNNQRFKQLTGIL
jgi:hypothetical protein